MGKEQFGKVYRVAKWYGPTNKEALPQVFDDAIIAWQTGYFEGRRCFAPRSLAKKSPPSRNRLGATPLTLKPEFLRMKPNSRRQPRLRQQMRTKLVFGSTCWELGATRDHKCLQICKVIVFPSH
ncbi:hypothetical protein GGE16_005885 [Rhizobium leguminosarum]|uniref:Uncharacterized protein n=1 Tax=Rhizobium leguminosarum TaxID=384 RepID=A0AAE2MQA2_RHILE|nr:MULTISPECIES: conjugal transfer protein TraH [Rhizobium]ARM90868.1 conjugal transfer TraH domain-containing protein [Rhizobium sp. CIAT894]MBB4293791.1 hypothetical protein [Rhizobium leguminosarum]MBB4299391.1 hypothetical protein [Rhizobium leguminosarum]MBB4310890.1 hypothetical protein [Rhizobium leguminosarum]MBB4419998.1 hypothetical protein [Rhizobium leguminosarum]